MVPPRDRRRKKLTCLRGTLIDRSIDRPHGLDCPLPRSSSFEVYGALRECVGRLVLDLHLLFCGASAGCVLSSSARCRCSLPLEPWKRNMRRGTCSFLINGGVVHESLPSLPLPPMYSSFSPSCPPPSLTLPDQHGSNVLLHVVVVCFVSLHPAPGCLTEPLARMPSSRPLSVGVCLPE